MPAARSLQQRYNVGSCTLAVTLQPSALSQWHPRPVAEQLSFKLWLQEANLLGLQGGLQGGLGPTQQVAEQTPATLVAEGDRTTLQAIAQHLQQQTRQALTITSPQVQSESETLRKAPSLAPAISTPPQLPPECLIEGPLSYLQLCDLTAVLNQYEQATCVLPVALGSVASAGSEISNREISNSEISSSKIASSETNNETASEIASKVGNSTNNNVIPLPLGRGRIARRGLARSRNRNIWASSAAAALLTVGLTTTLLNNRNPPQESAITADSASDGVQAPPELSAALPRQTPDAEKTPNNPPTAKPSEPSPTSEAPASDTNRITGANRSTGTGRASALIAGNPSGNPARSSAGRRTLSEAQSRDLETAAQRPASSPDPDRSTAEEAAPTTPTNPATRPSPAAGSSAANLPAADLPAAEAPADDALDSERTIAAAPPAESAAPLPADADALSRANPADGATTESATPPIPSAEPASPAPVSNLPAEEPARESAAVEGLILEDNLPNARQASRLPQQQERADDNAISTEEAFSDEVPPAADIINRVETYFQLRWQANPDLSEPFIYQLQLTEIGEVTSFAGLSSAAQNYRDRFLPAGDRPLSFSDGSSPETAQDPTTSLTLRVILTPAGDVQILRL